LIFVVQKVDWGLKLRPHIGEKMKRQKSSINLYLFISLLVCMLSFCPSKRVEDARDCWTYTVSKKSM